MDRLAHITIADAASLLAAFVAGAAVGAMILARLLRHRAAR